MTADPPHDGADDATGTDDDSDQAHDEDPSAASADAGMPAADGNADRETTPNAESQSDSKTEPERDGDDLAAELARKRPPQPPQEDLDKIQQPATELRSAIAQEAGTDSDAGPADPAPATAQDNRAARGDDSEHESGGTGLDELQPVATELRPAAAQAADAQATASATADTADTDRARDRDADAEPEDEGDEV